MSLAWLRSILGSSDSVKVWEKTGGKQKGWKCCVTHKNTCKKPHIKHKFMGLFFFFVMGYIMNYFYPYKWNDYKKFFPALWQMPVLDILISLNHHARIPALAPVIGYSMFGCSHVVESTKKYSNVNINLFFQGTYIYIFNQPFYIP